MKSERNDDRGGVPAFATSASQGEDWQESADPLHRALLHEVARAGCFRPAPLRTLAYGVGILAVYAAAYLLLLTDPGWLLRAPALLAIAFASVQAGFVAHEAGHGALTRNRRIARAVGQLFNTVLTALCHSYFRHIHGLHHPYCNDPARDPDMQSGVFGLYPQAAREKRGVGRFISRRQALLIWVLVWLQGFTLKIDSLGFLCRERRATRADQLGLLVHFALWSLPPLLLLGPLDALTNYALMTLAIGPYLGAIFLVNHIGTRIVEADEAVPFFVRELSATRNLGDSRLQDFFFGGLNNHIEHHLFPSMPTTHLRRARPITRAFCARHGIPYRETSWWAAACEVRHHFHAMSLLVPG